MNLENSIFSSGFFKLSKISHEFFIRLSLYLMCYLFSFPKSFAFLCHKYYNKNGCSKYIKLLSFLVILLILPAAYALKITPYIDAGELQYNKSYSYFIYIENDENAAKSITMKITPRASYLSPYVKITPKTFLLGKNSARNVLVELIIPNSMPGEHQLTIIPEISEAGGGVTIVSTFATTIMFSLPGNVVKSLIVEDLSIAINKDITTFTVKAKNNGNVRVSAFPAVEIWRGDSFLARIEGNTEFLMDAGTTKSMDLKYTASSNGRYRAVAFVRYDGIATNKIEKEFEIISLPQQQQSGGSSDNGSASVGSSGYNNLNATAPKSTVNISGEHTASEGLKILKFTVDSARLEEPLVMLLSLENTGSKTVNYEYVFEVTAGGALLYTQADSDTINRFETKEIRHTWLGKPGNYTVRAAVLYNGQLLEAYSNVKVNPIETPTGLAIGDQSNVIIIIVIILIAIAFIIIWKKKFRA